jgi:hypothetical protein
VNTTFRNMTRVPVLAAAITVAVAIAWSALRVYTVYNGNWTALFYVGEMFSMPKEVAERSVRNTSTGYDGQFYRLLAYDPILAKDYFKYADAPNLRFRRMLLSEAAWVLALGRSDWIDPAYICLEFLLLGAGVYWTSIYFHIRGRSPWFGLIFAVIPASLCSIDRMLVDGTLTALCAAFCLYCEKQRWPLVWLVAALAALTRETGLILCIALVVDSLISRAWLSAFFRGLSAAPAFLWYFYLSLKIPPDPAIPALTLPGVGLIQRLLLLRSDPHPLVQFILRATDIIAVLGLLVSAFLVLRLYRHKCSRPMYLSMVMFAIMVLVLGAPGIMIEAFAFARPASPLLLMLMLEGIPRQVWMTVACTFMLTASVSLSYVGQFFQILRALKLFYR